LTVIRQFFGFCVDLDLLSKNPADKIKAPKVDHLSTTNGLSKEEAEEFLRQPDRSTLRGKRDFAMLFLMINNGLRRSEVTAIRWGDFGQERGYSILMIRGKGAQEDITKIKPSVMEAIEAYKEASGRAFGKDSPLFITSRTKGGEPSERAEKALSPETIRVMVKKNAALAQIKKRVSPHSLRHTCITLCLDGGGSIRQAQYLARHGDPRTTMRYDRNRNNLDDHGTDYVQLRP
ncbi:MAG: tyrosine-type recombinase/integrase, partial [Candidatus Latescibacteria bacterium]|nr:tyrosine-type recombinase/integrase [Candidatus Latescibacterota bacterium]